MKNRIGIFVIIIIAEIVFISCEPVENRHEMTGNVTMKDIEGLVTVTQELRNGKKSNFFSFNSEGLKAATAFKYSLGTSTGTGTNGQFIQCFLFPGPADIVFTALNPDGTSLSKTFNFTIDEAFDVAPQWDLITASSSKTWVFDGTGGDGGVWWAMSDPGDPTGIWWNAGGDCCPPSDANGRMVFEAQGLGVTVYSSPNDASPKKGTFSFNRDFTELTFKDGANALGSESNAGNNGIFKVVELSKDKLHLFVPNASGGTGWVWVFKPQ